MISTADPIPDPDVTVIEHPYVASAASARSGSCAECVLIGVRQIGETPTLASEQSTLRPAQVGLRWVCTKNDPAVGAVRRVVSYF